MRSAPDQASVDYVVLPGPEDPSQKRSNAATGASAAGVRAVMAQFVSFYFRAPIKAFFRTRFDYTAFARKINPRVQAGESWSWRMTTPFLLGYAIREHGWSFIPNQVLPPMLANVTVGAILYTVYLQSLGKLHEPAGKQAKRVYPPPSVESTFRAGFIAGGVQSVVAAPLDALQVRFKTNDMLEGKYKNMWQYARSKLVEIGPRGVFAGWTLSFVKDSLGFAVFFATFETIKSQAYYAFVRRWYGNIRPVFLGDYMEKSEHGRPVIKPHYLMEPTFLLVAGASASIAQQAIQHPLTTIQNIHYGRLESIDYAAKLERTRASIFRLYFNAYQKTYAQCEKLAAAAGGWRAWLYRDFLYTTLRQTPSTAAGLIVFEIVRRRYAIDSDRVKISKDGYDILLT